MEGNPVLNDNLKPVENYAGIYWVHPDGAIWNGTKFLKTYTINSGYKCLKLTRAGKRESFLLHRLVAAAYIPNPDHLSTVNHIDGDKQNNAASNLEWCSHLNNVRHAIRTGLTVYNRPTLGQVKGVSKYHRVGWDARRGKWNASVFYEGKTRDSRRFDCEVTAARYADELLVRYGITDRPRNFPKEA